MAVKIKQAKNISFRRSVIATVLIITMLSAALAGVIGAVLAITGHKDPGALILEDLDNLKSNTGTTIFVKSGGEWTEYRKLYGGENRIWADYNVIPGNLKNAFVSIEDERFWTHNGVDWKRTISAFANMFLNFYSSNQGGSTITQQLVKNLTGDNSQSGDRKLREIKRALAIEKKYPKETILGCYLNSIYFGNSLYGVEAAAEYYFGKTVSELSLAECASIAAIVKNPAKYIPDKHPEENRQRRDLVLKKMNELGYIGEAEYNAAKAEPVITYPSIISLHNESIYDYFTDTLINEFIGYLEDEYHIEYQYALKNIYTGGYKIYATVDLNVQNALQSVYENTGNFAALSSKGEQLQSAMTVMDYAGHIVGIVGGSGPKEVNLGLNRAMYSPRQPGSTIKPLSAYSLSIDKNNITYSTVIEDSPLENYGTAGNVGPSNWYGDYYGNMTVERALELSVNTIPCKLIQNLGTGTVYSFLHDKLDFSYLTNEDKNLSALALGGMSRGITTTQSAAAYAMFGNGGKYFKPTTIDHIDTPSGERVYTGGDEGKQVISSASASVMNKLLQNVVFGAEGTGRGMQAYMGMPMYAKTGTSNDTNDLWFVGGTPYYVASCWVGFDYPETIYNSGAALNIWGSVMSTVHSYLGYRDFDYDSGVQAATYCVHTGALARTGCPATATGFYTGNFPGYCTEHGGDEIDPGLSGINGIIDDIFGSETTAETTAAPPVTETAPPETSAPQTLPPETLPPEETTAEGPGEETEYGGAAG